MKNKKEKEKNYGKLQRLRIS